MEIIKKCSEDWMVSDPKLERNQVAVDLDTDRVKFGDGKKHWSELDYTPYIEFANNNKPYVTPESFGDLSEDDTAIIQAAVDSGMNVRFTKGVTYTILETITIGPKSNNSIINGQGATLSFPSIESTEKKPFIAAFWVDNGTKNVVLENLNFVATDRLKEGRKINTSSLDFKCSNRECINIYQETENILVQNCTFDKVAYCVRFKAHGDSNNNDSDKLRKNIIIKNIKATNVSECIDGGGATDGLYINNIHVELAPTTNFHHAIYLQSKLKKVRIENFFIKQSPLLPEEESNPNISHYDRYGRPISIYTTGQSNDSCTEPVYISNGEIHASSFLVSSNPYVIYADNIHYINDVSEESTAGDVMFNHSEESFGYYTNCTFENSSAVRNGVFTNCKFKLFGTGSNILYLADAVFNNEKIERTFFNGCLIDLNNATNLVNIQEAQTAIEATDIAYRIKFKDCTIDNSADELVLGDRIISSSSSICAGYKIEFIGCDFRHPFDMDHHHASIKSGGEKASLNVTFNKCSLKSKKSFPGAYIGSDYKFEKTTGTGVTKSYILCDLDNVIEP